MKRLRQQPWLLVVCLVQISPLAGNAVGPPISDQFTDGNDDGWTHYEPLAPFGARAAYSFPDSGSPAPFGVGYRIQASASPDPGALGFGRAGSLRFDSFRSAPAVIMYVVGWNDTLNQSFGVLTDISSVGRGTTDGYALTYSTAGILSLSRIDNEQFTVLASLPATLNPAKEYTFFLQVFPSGGISGDVGEVQTASLVGHLTAGDRTYSGGISGLYAFSNVPDGTADATFDWFQVGMSVPEPSSTSLVLVAGSLFVIWRFLKRARDVKRRSPPVA